MKKTILVYPRRYFVADQLEIRRNGEKLITAVMHELDEEYRWLVKAPDEVHSRRSDVVSIRSLAAYDPLLPIDKDFLSDGHLYSQLALEGRPNNIAGWIRREGRLDPIDEVSFVGAEMSKVLTANSTFVFPGNDDKFLVSDYALQRWQMTIKAIGLRAWQRLCRLKVVVIGAGRSGEKMATALVRAGIRWLRVGDPDRIELGNLGEMDNASDEHIGSFKADVISDHLRMCAPDDSIDVRAIRGYCFDSFEFQKAMEQCDVICCCIDSDAGRNYAAHIARRYCKVLIDIATGIVINEAGDKVTGYDVRLIFPWDEGFSKFGGLDEKQAEIEMFSADKRREQRATGNIDRLGSLSHLNMMAVGQAMEMLFAMVAGRLRESTWRQWVG